MKFLKWILYILIPIFLANIIISSMYVFMTETKRKETDNSFKEDSFIRNYMSYISILSSELIFNNANYHSIKDDNNTICYWNDSYRTNIENLYFLIVYKDKALTNIELTSDTNTLEKIKKYIENIDQKKTYFINGEVQSDTDFIQKKAIQFFDNFKFTYYTVDQDNDDLSTYYEDYDNDYYEGYQDEKKYYTTSIGDFQIYMAYNEKMIENYYYDDYFYNILNNLFNNDNFAFLFIVINLILFLGSIIFVTCLIGVTKEKNVKLFKFDKIWYEIIFGISILVGCLAVLPLCFLLDIDLSSDNFNLLTLVILLTYFIIYFIAMFNYSTLVRRIKGKCLVNSTFCGKCFIFVKNNFKNTIIKIKNCFEKYKNILSRKQRLVFYISGLIVLEFLLMLIFSFVGVAVDIIILICFYNKIIKILDSYLKIENKLKDIYEGENKLILDPNELEEDFKQSAIYINDISSGFENAIEESIKSEKLKTELITNVSHDIKTPLTSIINYADLLKQENIENEKSKEYINILDNKSQRLKKLIDDLIDASKASSGAIKLNLEKINIVEFFNQAIGEFKDRFESKKLEIITNFSDSEINLNLDSRYFYRVVENLFNNISKYSLENTRVYIDIIKSENSINISIKNISKDKLNISSDELVQRFVRGDKSRTTEGSGLGISIAKSLVELQKGEFDLEIDGDLFKVIIKF